MSVPKELRQAREAMIAAITENLAPDLFRHTVVLARTPLQPDGPPQPGLQYFVGTGTLAQVDAGERCARCVNALKLSQMDRISAYLKTDRITAYVGTAHARRACRGGLAVSPSLFRPFVARSLC